MPRGVFRGGKQHVGEGAEPEPTGPCTVASPVSRQDSTPQHSHAKSLASIGRARLPVTRGPAAVPVLRGKKRAQGGQDEAAESDLELQPQLTPTLPLVTALWGWNMPSSSLAQSARSRVFEQIQGREHDHIRTFHPQRRPVPMGSPVPPPPAPGGRSSASSSVRWPPWGISYQWSFSTWHVASWR